MIVFIHDDEGGALVGIPDALKNALFVLRVRLVTRFGREHNRGFIRLAPGFDTQLIHARPSRRGRSSLRNQARCNPYERNRALRCVQITWRGGFLQCVPDTGMSQVAAFYLPKGVLNARNLQIKRMIIG